MTWQEPAVFFIVIAAAAYIGRVFVQQFGSAASPKPTACSTCSSCGSAAQTSPQSLLQIARRKNG